MESIDKIKLARSKQILPFKDTTIEVAIQESLSKHNINFEKHKSIFGQPDIFIKPNIAIFCDGDYWHSRQSSIERDALVNKTLEEKGYRVIRFWEKEIRRDVDLCVEKIIKFV